MEGYSLAASGLPTQHQPIKRQRSEQGVDELPPVKKHIPSSERDVVVTCDLMKRGCIRTHTGRSVSAPPLLGEQGCLAPDSRRAIERMVAYSACYRVESTVIQAASGHTKEMLAKQFETMLEMIMKESTLDDSAKAVQMRAFLHLLHDVDIPNFIMNSLRTEDVKEKAEKVKALIEKLSLSEEDFVFFMAFLDDGFLVCSPEELQWVIAYVFLLQQNPAFKEDKVEEDKNNAFPEIAWCDAEDLKRLALSRLIGIACADLLLVLRNSECPTKIMNPAWIVSADYIETLQQRKALYSEVCPTEGYLPFFILLPFNTVWWQEVNSVSEVATMGSNISPVSAKQLAYFFEHTVLPEQLKTLLFENEQGAKGSLLSMAHQVLTASSCQPLKVERFLFGEEFEYEIPLKEGEELDADFDHVIREGMQQWKRYITTICPEATFVETQNNDEKGEDTQDTVTATIGDWQVKALPEFAAENGKPVIEFNASPYAIDQQFHTGQSSYSAYALLKKFVIEPAKKVGWIECSGHKHVDILGSIGNNTELLFRLLVDIENKSWLSVMTQQGRYAKQYFPYICQTERADVRQRCLKKALDVFNHCLEKGRINKAGHASVKTLMLKLWWQMISGSGMDRGPGSLNCCSVATPESALKGEVCDPDSTLEFRFFHCARSGNEVKLINQLLVAWIKHLSQQQEAAEPISYQPVDPEQVSHAEAVSRFRDFVDMLGLGWEEYQQLIWYPEAVELAGQGDTLSGLYQDIEPM